MSSDLQIINTVLGSIHSGMGHISLTSLYSPNFTFESPVRGIIGFEDYCGHLAAISNNCQLEVNSIVNMGCCYELEMELIIIDRAEKEFSRLPASANIFIENSIIQKITSNYVASPAQVTYIKKYVELLNFKPKSQ